MHHELFKDTFSDGFVAGAKFADSLQVAHDEQSAGQLERHDNAIAVRHEISSASSSGRHLTHPAPLAFEKH